jgi:Gpi18-like mannosyltransferase
MYTLSKPNYIQILLISTTGLLILLQSLSIYYLIVSYYPSSLYCQPLTLSPPPPQWCQGSFSNLYSYIQKTHWKVGWLCSYESKRILDIFWGMQTLFLVLKAMADYLHQLSLFNQTTHKH